MKKYIIIWSILIVFLSCRKDKDDPEQDPLSVFVHGAGTQIQPNSRQAMYMKNSQIVSLSAPAGLSTEANDIQISGSDVYIVGVGGEVDETALRPLKALLWKNGELQELITPASTETIAKAVFVSGNDVYVAGSYQPAAENAKRIAAIWKNGELSTIGSPNNNTRLEDIFVSGNDVYVVGTESAPGDRVISKYWKNGVETVLSAREGTTHARSICVEGNDVYVVGYTELNGRSLNLWKNGVRTDLISGRTVIRGGSVAVNSGNVYVAGYEQVGSTYAPRVFKNGELLPMEYANNDGHVYAHSVQVVEDKTYVLGERQTEGTWPISFIWENGVEIDFLTATTSQFMLNSICVVPKDAL